MAWTATTDGKMECSLHSAVFAVGRSCPSCSGSRSGVGRPTGRLGTFESIDAEAERLGLNTRLSLEAKYGRCAIKAERQSADLVRQADAIMARYPIDAENPAPNAERAVALAVSLYSTAAKWFTEASRYRRAIADMVFDRERRADAEKFERLHPEAPSSRRTN